MNNEAIFDYAAKFKHDPLSWAHFAFPWGEGELKSSDGPRDWQSDTFQDIKDHLSDEETRYEPLMIGIASGHGIGKSSEISMIMHWAMSTCVDCKVVVTANTDSQLKTKTWPEVTKWFRMAINSSWFNITATSVSSVVKKREKSWRCDAIPWSKERPEAFAGLHNEGKRIVIIFDEASAIADKIWEVTEGALTDENTEIIWLAFGNPTRNTGRFKQCFGKLRHRWKNRQIDSRTVEGTNKKQIAKWEQDYGEDSDFFRVRVRGVFPQHSTNQLVSEHTVDACREYQAHGYEVFPIRIGADIAGEGEESDNTVITVVQGNKVHEMFKVHLSPGDIGTDKIYQALVKTYDHYRQKHDRVMIYVDAIGIGKGVYDLCRMARLPVMGVISGASANDPVRFTNIRIEMWYNMAQWLKEGVDLTALRGDEFNLLKDDLVNIEYSENIQTQKYTLESVKSLKDRGLGSPDYGSALAFTLAYPVPISVQSGRDTVKKADGGGSSVMKRKKRGK